MRRTSIFVALVVALGGVTGTATAAPSQKNSDSRVLSPHRDDVQITVRAGRGRLGIVALQISPELRQHLGAPPDRGVLIDSVRPDSPAARAGVQVGDVITSVDGEVTRTADDVLEALADRKKGDTVQITVIRANKRVQLEATLEDNPGPFRAFGKLDGFDFGRFDFDEMFPFRGFGDRELRRSLEESRRRIEELERRLEKLERT